jgi:DNA processing protein
MTMFGLDESSVAPLMRAITGEELDDPDIAERFARASWTGISEPGDRIAGMIVEALGAGHALTALVERWQPARIVQLITDAGGTVTEAEAAEALARWQPRLTSATALIALKQAKRNGVTLLTPHDTHWPEGMNDLGLHQPIALWVRGNVSTVGSLPQSISLVGARAATGYGEHVAMDASAGLVDRGFTIVSGAAYGIDGMAHRAALASGGQTLAFLAGGVDRFYPSGHDALLTRIVEKGAVVSELPCGSQPTKWRFLQRNRLIAAASQATVVIEAGWRSGSLNTAGHAAALGRPLGAVPGPVTSAASAGCHRLIRDFDATCVTTAAEMAELAPCSEVEPDTARTPTGSPDAATTRVLDALNSRAPRDAADIAGRSGLSIDAVRATLGRAQLEGTVAERERGWVKVVAKRAH